MPLLFLLYIFCNLLTIVIVKREGDGRSMTEQNLHVQAWRPVDLLILDIPLNWNGFSLQVFALDGDF